MSPSHTSFKGYMIVHPALFSFIIHTYLRMHM